MPQDLMEIGRRLTKWATTIMLWAGTALLLLAAVFALHTWLATRSFLRADAVVTENMPTQNEDGTLLYTTHLRFQAPGGGIVAFTDPVQSSHNDEPSFPIGATVPVLYPSGHPGEARIATIWRFYFVANILGILGVVLVDLSLILRLVLKRSKGLTWVVKSNQ